MVSTREPYELSPSSERRYSLQRFIPHAPNIPKAGSFKFPSVPHNPLQAFDSILHKELVDHVVEPVKPKPQARPRDSSAHRRDPSIIVSIRHYHIMLKSLEEAPCETSRNSWVYDQPKLKTRRCCVVCRRSFVYNGTRAVCSMCAAIKSAYEYHETLRPKSSCTLNYIPRSTPRQSWQTSNSYRPSTISYASYSEGQSSLYRTETSSTYQLPTVCILISRSRILFLPGLSHSYILGQLTSDPSSDDASNNAHPLSVTPLYRTVKPNNDPPSTDSDRTSIRSRTSKVAKSNRTSLSATTTSSSSTSPPISSTRKRTKKRNTSTRFGCPFAKRNPSRYERVIGSCTMPRGMEMKYIVEHLDRTHSGKTACPYCHEKWPTNTSVPWTTMLHEHTVTSPCLDAADMLCEPEALNEVQQAALDAYKSERHTEPEPQRWVNLFMALFPDEFPIPSPYYDFYTPTHLIQPRNRGLEGGSIRGAGDSGSINSVSLSQLPSSDSSSTLLTTATGGSESISTEMTQGEGSEVDVLSNGHGNVGANGIAHGSGTTMNTTLNISSQSQSQTHSSTNTIAPRIVSPMLLATTSIDEFDPSFEPLEFDEKLPIGSDGLVHHHIPHPGMQHHGVAHGYLGSTGAPEYDSAETMVMHGGEAENQMLPMTFGQIWNANVGDMDMSMGLMGNERMVERPGVGQDAAELLEMLRGQLYQAQ